MRIQTMGWLVLGILASGCVTTGAYDRKVAELQGVTDQHDQQAKEREGTLRAQLQAQIDELQREVDSLKAQLAACGTDRDHLKVELDDATALIAELKKKIEKLGQNVEKLTAERGQLSAGLADAKARLEELRRAQEAAELRAKAFHDLLAKFQSMIDPG